MSWVADEGGRIAGTSSRNRIGRAIRSTAGLIVLLGLSGLGIALSWRMRLPLPGPVIGLVLLALGLLGLERFRPDWGRTAMRTLAPAARLSLRHMGLLFVPAGAGIVTQGDMLRQHGLPIGVALVGSTLIGLVATGLVMQRLTDSAGGRP